MQHTVHYLSELFESIKEERVEEKVKAFISEFYLNYEEWKKIYNSRPPILNNPKLRINFFFEKANFLYMLESEKDKKNSLLALSLNFKTLKDFQRKEDNTEFFEMGNMYIENFREFLNLP